MVGLLFLLDSRPGHKRGQIAAPTESFPGALSARICASVGLSCRSKAGQKHLGSTVATW